MSKKTKSKGKKVKVVPDNLKPKELASADHISFTLSVDDVQSVILMMRLSQEMFGKLAIIANEQADALGAETHAARAQLCGMIRERFDKFAKIGEPTSREVH